MRSTILLAAVVTGNPAILAEELRAADVPSACTTICQPIVELTNTCDVDPNEADMDNDERRKLRVRATEDADEAIEANCISTNTSFDVAGVMALCASCIAQNGNTSDDVNKIMSQCSFTSASYAPSTTTKVAGIQVQATKPATATGASTSTSTSSASSSTNTAKNNAGKKAVSVVAAAGVCFAVLLAL